MSDLAAARTRRPLPVQRSMVAGAAAAMAAVVDVEMVAVDVITANLMAKLLMLSHSPHRSQWHAPDQTDGVIAVGVVTGADAIAFSNPPTLPRKAQRRLRRQQHALRNRHASAMCNKRHDHVVTPHADARDRTASKTKPPFLGE